MHLKQKGSDLPSVTDISRFAERCQHFLHGVASLTVTQLADSSQADYSSGSKDRHIHLSFAEIAVSEPPQERGSYDYLVFVFVRYGDDVLSPQTPIRAYIIGPGTISTHARYIASGLHITNVPVAFIPSSSREVSLVLYSIKRQRQLQNATEARLQTVIELIENLMDALDYVNDYPGSLKLAESILDHLDLLHRSSATTRRLGATFQKDEGDNILTQLPYLAITQANFAEDANRQYFVKDGSLYSGLSLETARLFRRRDFVLLHIGPKPVTREDLILSIRQQRQQLSIAGGALLLEEDDADQISNLEREQRLRTERRLTAIYTRQAMRRMPVVTPIAIEVAADLIPFVESETGTLDLRFQELIEMGREELTHTYGIKIPGIRVRGNETDLNDGTYIIMLDEVPLVTETIYTTMGFSSMTQDELRLFGVNAEPGIDQISGDEGAWVKKEDWQKVRDAGQTIRDVREYIVQHLFRVVSRNLVNLTGIQELAELIRDVESPGRAESLYSEIRSAPGGFARFTSVFQSLLATQVPTRDIKAIGDKYCELVAAECPIYEIPEELRCLDEIRLNLPGNHSDSLIFTLGPVFVEVFRHAVFETAPVGVLNLEPEVTQDVLIAIRNVVGPSGQVKDTVLLVDEWRLRPFIYDLATLEFPEITVLARRELEASRSMRILHEIEIE